ncbi:MAG: 3-phosphoshikimate 1-carboxyvinyltransferase [Firmicutes bacterium]|nr:3-phosphoshikimate 1-carboxyvinyltransferase [Bacillota bacterium]
MVRKAGKRQVILEVKPSCRLNGRVGVPGDKSISHRAALLGAIGQGVTRIDGFLESEDCLATLHCLSLLGTPIKRLAPGSYEIQGLGWDGFQEPTDVLNCGNSGTTMRLLIGVLASQPIFSVLTGDASLRDRPMGRVIEPLRKMEARIFGRGGDTRAPLAVLGSGNLKGKTHRLPVASAQVKSALLLAGLRAKGVTVVTEPGRSRNHTELMLQQMGVPVRVDGLTAAVEGGTLPKGGEITVPGDISSAAYLMVAAAVLPDSDITVENVGINSTRAGIIEVLQSMGADLEIEPLLGGGEPRANIRVRTSPLRGIEIGGSIVPTLIDELPVIAVAAAFAQGTTIVKDAAELRVKECDRIAAVAQELGRLGVDIEERADGWVIRGGKNFSGGRARGWGDHRIVMALAVFGLGVKSPVEIADAEAVSISFPEFVTTLRKLGAEVEEKGSDLQDTQAV